MQELAQSNDPNMEGKFWVRVHFCVDLSGSDHKCPLLTFLCALKSCLYTASSKAISSYYVIIKLYQAIMLTCMILNKLPNIAGLSLTFSKMRIIVLTSEMCCEDKIEAQ